MITRTDIINYLIWKQGYRSYLEIGLDDPEPNFTKIRCELKESVRSLRSVEQLLCGMDAGRPQPVSPLPDLPDDFGRFLCRLSG